jgi:hypothetical protein
MACEAEQAALSKVENSLDRAQDKCDSGIKTACSAIPRLKAEVKQAQARYDTCRVATRLVSIVGIERTQATQYFNFNGMGSKFGDDNSVPLVSGKTTILRVYIDTRIIAGQDPPVSITGRVDGFGLSLQPSNGPLAPSAGATVNRGVASATLNFLMSPMTSVTRTVTVSVFDTAHTQDPQYRQEMPLLLSFDTVGQPKIHGVLIHYTGRGLNIPAPTITQMQDTFAYLNKVYPVPGFNFTGFDVIDLSEDLTVSGGGGCGTGWNNLFTRLNNMRTGGKEKDSIYTGLLPPGVPSGGATGCGGTGVAIAFVNDGPTMAQEVGHAFSRSHAPCGNPGGPDPKYPTYPYPPGSIGEFGFDSSTLSVLNPATTFDFMSYCGPTWVSPYTYTGLKGAIVETDASLSMDGVPEIREAQGQYANISFRVFNRNSVSMLPSYVLEGSAFRRTGQRDDSAMTLDIVDANGGLLARHLCSQTAHHAATDVYMDFHESLVWPPGAARIQFAWHDELIGAYDVSGAAPTLTEMQLESFEDADELHLRWQGPNDDVPGEIYYMVRYTYDDGVSWRVLASDLMEPNVTVRTDLLPGGATCRFEVVGSRGLATSRIESEPIDVPVKASLPIILSPTDGVHVSAEQLVVFRGSGFSPNFGTTSQDDLIWGSSRDGFLGVGADLPISTLSAGRHQITLTIPNELGGESSASVWIEITPEAHGAV